VPAIAEFPAVPDGAPPFAEPEPVPAAFAPAAEALPALPPLVTAAFPAAPGVLGAELQPRPANIPTRVNHLKPFFIGVSFACLLPTPA
jgi:hypothetical protein